jgi:uncharacterized protein (DUF488 family)
VQVVADVCSYPYSNYSPHFDREPLARSLRAAGFAYVYLGREVGGRPEGAEYYDAEGHVLYGRVAESPAFREGLARLLKGIAEYRVAIMCSEEDPAGCHRRLLVGRVLAESGVAILHIRGDGTVQSEEELAALSQSDQLSLFEEPVPWKSIPSVSPKRPPNSSSAS